MPKLYGTPGTRALSPDCCTSESLAACSLGAQLLFDRLIVQADDQGRQEAHPAIVKAHCMPAIAEATARRVAGWLDELEHQSMIVRYRSGTMAVLQLRGWWTFQVGMRRAYPSRWQAPPGWVDRIFGVPDARVVGSGSVPANGAQAAAGGPAS